jgi:hypothetical protein
MRNCITNIAVTKLAETQGLALVFPAVAAVICGGGVSGGKIRADGTVFSCLPVHPARVLKIYNIYCYIASVNTKRDWLICSHVALDKCNVSRPGNK